MPDGVTVRVRGIDEVQRALTNFVGDLRKTLRTSLRSAARPMLQAARANAPVLKQPTRRRVPGTLRRNIKIFNSKRANGRGGVIGVYLSVGASPKDLKRAPVSGDPYYWRWVESGHKIVARFKGKYTDFKRRGRGRLTGLVKRQAASTRSVEGRQYILRAYRSHGQTTIDRFSGEVLARVDKANRAK